MCVGGEVTSTSRKKPLKCHICKLFITVTLLTSLGQRTSVLYTVKSAEKVMLEAKTAFFLLWGMETYFSRFQTYNDILTGGIQNT